MPRIHFALAVLACVGPVFAAIINVVTDRGCPNNGTGNAAIAINQAIGQAATQDTVYVPAGVYLLLGSIVPVNGTKLVLDTAAEMRRGWNGGTAWSGALINPNTTALAHDVHIRGGKWSCPGNAFSGRVMNLTGDRWLVERMNVVSWGTAGVSSICFAVQGSDIEIRDCRAVGCPGDEGQAGVRVQGGRRIYVHDCYMEAGDDTYCAFPTENINNWGAGADIDSVVYERCHGVSFAARFLAGGITVAKTEVQYRNLVTVSRVMFLDCRGESRDAENSPVVLVYNANPDQRAKVRDFSFLRCAVKSTNPNNTVVDAVRITAESTGLLRNVSMDQCTTFAAKNYAVTVSGSDVDSVSLRNCSIDGAGGALEALSIRGSIGVTVDGCSIIAGASDGVKAEATGIVRFVKNRVSAVPAGRAGVRVLCAHSYFEGNTITEKSGAAGSQGIIEASGADYNLIRCNDCSEVDEAYPQKAVHSEYADCSTRLRMDAALHSAQPLRVSSAQPRVFTALGQMLKPSSTRIHPALETNGVMFSHGMKFLRLSTMPVIMKETK